MATYRRVYDSRRLQADCQVPGSAPEPYAWQSCMGYLFYCITQVLLESGANPDSRDSYDNSALLMACETGSYNIAKLLVDCNASVELHHTAGRGTAMHQVPMFCISTVL